MKKLEHLMSPIRVKSLEIPNRVVIPPMGTSLGNTDGTVSEANLAYIANRASSGAGLFITEITAVHPIGQVSPRSIGIWDDSFIPGLSKIADIIHAAGSKASLQLHHAGREIYRFLKDKTAVGPSAEPSHIYGFLGTPREMTIEQIKETIEAFGAGARRAREAGFDMVELHGAHGYLLMQFLSAFSNKRKDEYGGDFKARSRFMLECLEAARKQVGSDFPISIRISGEECIRGGYTIDDILTIIPGLEKSGADIINVSFGTHGSPDINIDTPNASAPVEYEPGFKSYLARKIKEVATVPVISVGRYTDPFFMDEVIARGDADMIAVGRQNLADPDFLKNALEGHQEDTLECIACNQGCIERLSLENKPIRCAINPKTGQELQYPKGPASKKQRVWIIGGGPAGLTAAFEAARLGHSVTLYERENTTGGNVRYAALAPHKEVYDKYIRTLTSRCKKLGVDIQLGVNVTEKMIEDGNPEAVILATGADKTECPVETSATSVVCDAWEILDSSIAPKKHILIMGAGLVGLETADFLCEKGVKDVTVVEQQKRPPVLPQAAHGQMLYRRLMSEGIKLVFGSQVKKIGEGEVFVTDKDGDRVISPVDQVIVAVGVTPRTELKEFLTKKGIRHFIAGDAVESRRIIEATTEGARAAWEL